MAKKPRENRVPIMMSDDELTAIDDWRFSKRVATRSDAVRRLSQIGLAVSGHEEEIKELADEAIKLTVGLAHYLRDSTDGSGREPDDKFEPIGVSFEMMSVVVKAFTILRETSGSQHLWGSDQEFHAVLAIARGIRDIRSSDSEGSEK